VILMNSMKINNNFSITVLLINLFLIINIAHGEWIQDGGVLNVADSGGYPDIAFDSNTPYVSWHETNGVALQGIVKHYLGGTWVQVGDSLNVDPNQHAASLKIAFYNNTPYVTWAEGNTAPRQIYVKRYVNNAWELVGTGSLNVNPAQNAESPNIAINNNGTPYVTWFENNSPPRQIYVKYYNGSTWVQVGSGSLNVDANQDALVPDIAIFNGTPYVTWYEDDGTGQSQVYVKHFTGLVWVQDGGSLNINTNESALNPKIAIFNSTPYVTWYEYYSTPINKNRVYVKRLCGSSWEQVGGFLNIDPNESAESPAIAQVNTTLYVTWHERGQDVYVKYLDGLNWVQVGTKLDIDPARYSRFPRIAGSNGLSPYVTWHEDNYINAYVYVKHLAKSVPLLCLPDHAASKAVLQMKIIGFSFSAPLTAKLVHLQSGHTITGSNINIPSDHILKSDFDLSSAQAGYYNLQIDGTYYGNILQRGFHFLQQPDPLTEWIVNDLGHMGDSIVESNFSGLAVGDGDNDGLKEVYGVCRNNSIYQFEKTNSTWSKTTVYSSGTMGEYYTDICVIDGNNEGKLEIYGITTDNHVYQFSSLLGWNQEDMGTGGTSAALYRLHWGDGDNNGWLKVYAACSDGHIYQFQKSVDVWNKDDLGSLGGEVYSLAVGDGDNDGLFEVYGANSNWAISQIKYNGSSWVISSVGFCPNGTYTVLVADADQDGKQEVYGGGEDTKVYQFKWSGSSWERSEVGQCGGKIYDMVVNDGDNSGQDAIYTACGDGHVYQFKWKNSAWVKTDLGNTGTLLLAIEIGDGDNDNQYEIYTVGSNNHIYQFKTSAQAPTPTPTFTVTPTATPLNNFSGRIISKNYIYAAPNPIRDNIANIVIYTKTPAEVSAIIYTSGRREVLSFHRYYDSSGKHEEKVNMSNLANGVYFLLVEARDGNGHEERAITKIALIK